MSTLHCCKCLLVNTIVCCLALLWGRTWIIFLFGRTFLIRCFNVSNVCKQCSEMTVAPLSSNSTNKIPSLSQKTLPMTLCAEAWTLNFSFEGDGWHCHSTALYQWPIMMSPGISTSSYVWKKSIFVFLTVLTKLVLHICFVGSFVFNGEHFCHTLCANCSEPSTMMMAITNFPLSI